MSSSIGSLTVVGTGFQVAGQITAEARAEIQRAERIFFIAAEPATRQWLQQTNPAAESLYDAYAPGRSRALTYAAMVERILAPVRAGQRVCVALYGHPGVFVQPSHAAIRIARSEGYPARMLPAVSAEDCLYADLEIDPATVGCQSYEATHFTLYRPCIDRGSALILWQIGAVGVRTYESANLWSRPGLALLAELLEDTYPPDHPVVVYEGADLPLTPSRIDHLPLGDLASATVTTGSTLYVPPVRRPPLDPGRLDALGMKPPASVTFRQASASASTSQGSLTLVGTGYGVAGHIDAQTLANMRRADRLFYLLSDPVTCQYLRSLHPNTTDLGDCYSAGEAGAEAARRMVDAMLAAVREGRRVCAAFNGHPAIGLFPAHLALRTARAEGHPARMLPAVSFEDCLIADLGVDPATHGRTLYDATEFLIRPRTIDTASALVLLQAGAIGLTDFQDRHQPNRPGLRLLAAVLGAHYPPDQPVTIYELAQLPFLPPRIETGPLEDLADALVSVRSTLFLPPARASEVDPERRALLASLA